MNIKSVLMALVLAASTPVFADDQATYGNSIDLQTNPVRKPAGYALDVLADVALRPAGFLGTLVGAVIYVTFLPATAINTIYEPHDNYEKLADLLVINPAKFTFTRPVGDYNYPQAEK